MSCSQTGLPGASLQPGLRLATRRSWTSIDSCDALPAVSHECGPFLISADDAETGHGIGPGLRRVSGGVVQDRSAATAYGTWAS